MPFETIILEKEDKVATLSLNRPDVLNAINNAMRRELLAALEDVAADDEVKVLVLTGKGRAFCSGGDVKGMGMRERMIKPHPIILKMVSLEKPVISAVNGVAAGAGCNLAMAADIIIASEKASFIQTFVKIGLVPDWGGMFFLPRLVGIYKAKELMLTGDRISAVEAERIGMVNKVVPDEEFQDFVKEYSGRLAKGAPKSMAMIKKTLNVTQNSDIDTVLALEYQAQTICRETADHKEGIAAFKEKRAPEFTGE